MSAIDAWVESVAELDRTPELERMKRLAHAVQKDLAAVRVDGLPPSALAFRPLADTEREAILAAVEQLGSVQAAADVLAISQQTIYRRLRDYRGLA